MCNTITAMIWRKEKKLEQIVETRKVEAEDDGDEENEKNRQNAVWLSLLNDNDILVVVE